MKNIIFTNRALSKMKTNGVSEHQALDTFNSGKVEKYGFGMNVIKKYAFLQIFPVPALAAIYIGRLNFLKNSIGFLL